MDPRESGVNLKHFQFQKCSSKTVLPSKMPYHNIMITFGFNNAF